MSFAHNSLSLSVYILRNRHAREIQLNSHGQRMRSDQLHFIGIVSLHIARAAGALTHRCSPVALQMRESQD
jgi:hypothetical protein